jgi:hypothetical protein
MPSHPAEGVVVALTGIKSGSAPAPYLRPNANHYCRPAGAAKPPAAGAAGPACKPSGPTWKDPKLVAGGLLFGVGWAIGGSCPGPMLVTVVSVFTDARSPGSAGHAVILLGTVAGIWIADIFSDLWVTHQGRLGRALIVVDPADLVRVHGAPHQHDSANADFTRQDTSLNGNPVPGPYGSVAPLDNSASTSYVEEKAEETAPGGKVDPTGSPV